MGDQPWISIGRQVNLLYPPVNHNEYNSIPGIVKVNDPFDPLTISPYSSTDSRCMGACDKILRDYERRDLQILLRQPSCHGRHSTIHHACRLAALSSRC